MTLEEVMSQLEQMGTEQTRKTWRNHGARGAVFGVKIGDMKTIQKKIKRDQELALALYKTGNSDAMYFAGLICDPQKMTKKQLQDWAKNATWGMLSEYTVPWAAAESKYGHELALEWIEAKEDEVRSAGWNTYSGLLALKKDEELDIKEITALLDRIRKTIHEQTERTKYTMNGFVISVGGYVARLTGKAKETGKAIGTVYVDMGGTACKVPDSVAYIEKIEGMGRVGKKKKTVFC
ncbi:DNA alkylation repair protein [Taibaiella koreensis]|uniref:DNA alkylation repair protein n=1 Tax=Taibaiella koreensis TaxID=1268548 RepID=UPI000E599FA4|nr:DNA alkylation repair protein [Taibaiella koreensis]